MHKNTINARLAAASVLIVDDSNLTRRILCRILAGLGVRTIYEAGDVLAGLRTVCSMAPDAVILDWEMPGLSGGDFLRIVRSPDKFPFPDTPVIVLSGRSEQRIVTQAFCAGVNEYLIKPVSPTSVRGRLIEVLLYPRKIIRADAYYGPEPRKDAALLQPEAPKDRKGRVWVDA